MDEMLKTFAKYLLSQSGYYKLRALLSQGDSPKLLIVMYHDLAEDGDALTMNKSLRNCLSRSQFEAHLRALRNHFRVITVEDAVREIQENGDLMENSIAITFDDGYASVYIVAFPLLKQNNLKATVFLTTSWIDSTVESWWDDLTDQVATSDFTAMKWPDVEPVIGLDGKQFALDNSLRSKQAFLERAEARLRQLEDAERDRELSELKALLAPDPSRKPALMPALTWPQIREMVSYGIKLGSHTHSHVNLARADLNFMQSEIATSKRIIEQNTGQRVAGLAYPYGGDFKAYAGMVHLLEGLGLDYACTSVSGSNFAGSNLFLLNRITLPCLTSQALLGRELYVSIAEHPTNLAGSSTVASRD